MSGKSDKRIGRILPGEKNKQTPKTNRIALLFDEYFDQGIPTELILYSDEKENDIENQISQLSLVMVWVNQFTKVKTKNTQFHGFFII